MLGGEPPHTGPSAWAIIAKKLAEPAPNVAVLRETVPEAVADAVARALATDPVDRYTTAEEFSDALALEAAVLAGWARSARGGPWRLAAAAVAGLIIGVMVLSLLGREEAMGASWIRDLAAQGSELPAIAVLPLTNLSSREENAYLAAGIHEELLRCLSLVRTLSVISRTSVLQYAGTDRWIGEIAAELGARYIVEGSVQADQGQVRVQVQLIDAMEDRHLWARRYDRSLENIFELQSEVAQAIADELKAVVGPEERERIFHLKYLLSLTTLKDIKVETDPVRLRPLDADLQVPDTTKFTNHTGWKPEIPFEKTMKDLLDYWRGMVKSGRVFPTR